MKFDTDVYLGTFIRKKLKMRRILLHCDMQIRKKNHNMMHFIAIEWQPKNGCGTSDSSLTAE